MKTTIIASLAILSMTPAYALEVSKSADVAAAPDAVWKTISEFCSIGQWHPAIEKCEPSMKDGKDIRTLSLKGGGTIVEERTADSEKGMMYSYKMLDTPLPVEDYKSTIRVMKHGKGSKVTWMGTFKAKGAPDAKAKEVVAGIYDAGLKGIADKAK